MNKSEFTKNHLYFHRFELPIWIVLLISFILSFITKYDGLIGIFFIGIGCTFILGALTQFKHKKFYYKFGIFKDGTGPKGRYWDEKDNLILWSFAGGLSILIGAIEFLMRFL